MMWCGCYFTMCLTSRSYLPCLYSPGLTPPHELTSGGLRSCCSGQPTTQVTGGDLDMLCSLHHDVHQSIDIVPNNDRLEWMSEGLDEMSMNYRMIKLWWLWSENMDGCILMLDEFVHSLLCSLPWTCSSVVPTTRMRLGQGRLKTCCLQGWGLFSLKEICVKFITEGWNRVCDSSLEESSNKSSLAYHVLELILKVGWSFLDFYLLFQKLWENFRV